MNDVFIIDAVRTPIGAYLGNYKKTESVDLGVSCLKDLFARNKKINTKEIGKEFRDHKIDFDFCIEKWHIK